MLREANDGTALISEDAMCDAVRLVLRQRNGEEPSSTATQQSTGGILNEQLDDLGIDSLTMAEIVVVLEQRLEVLLELAARGPLRTVGDLRHALQPVES